MKNLNNYIIEKFKINKDIKNSSKEEDDILNYKEFISSIEKNIKSLKPEEGEMIMKKSFPTIKKEEYDYLYIDPEIYSDDWRFSFQIKQAADYINHPNKLKEDKYYEHRYSYNIIGLSVYLYTNYNLSNDDGDEYYIYFMDFTNDRFYIYQFIKNGKTNIKKLK